MTVIPVSGAESRSPLDVIEQLIADNDWVFDRPSDEEIAIQVPGRWCDYNLYFAWNAPAGAMHFTLAFDIRVPDRKRPVVNELLALANEKLWMGHFAVWHEEGLITYRHALPLRGSAGPTLQQIEDLMQNGIIECERFYPAFQYVIWGGKAAAEALAAAMIDTVGEA
ncbi:MAG: YbjN domain-containing protein [Rhodospirillales bacterium]